MGQGFKTLDRYRSDKDQMFPPDFIYEGQNLLETSAKHLCKSVLEAIRIKFRLDQDLLQQCFNDLIKTKLSNFLYEERRREARRRLRDQERIYKQNMTQQNQSDLHASLNGEEEEESTHQSINIMLNR
ncbi:unnamed protein product [Rotaria magnacalcarata]|uniref:Uncharacterized protein n=1 Tax=Rotaria magnacalcarata TaxID=392030 RepID=A0A820CSA4_9BILA|nr:unnamed protein product [Rotaria magnacalcarata]